MNGYLADRKKIPNVLTVAFIFLATAAILQAQLSPQQISEDIDLAIKNYFVMTNPLKISVDEKGLVILNGQVKTLQAKYRINDIVAAVTGVQSIQNDLTVTPTVADDKALGDILQEMLTSILSVAEPARIKVGVKEGVVTLTGEVKYYREKLIVQNYFYHQRGVKEIINQLVVLPPPEPVSDGTLRDMLHEVLENRLLLDEVVTFTVNKGVITVKGEVPTLWNKLKVEEEFLRVLGVRRVVNDLKIHIPTR